MVGAAVGRIEAFSAENESISEQLECIELYFTANRISEERQVPVFLSVIGRDTCSLLRSLVSSASSISVMAPNAP